MAFDQSGNPQEDFPPTMVNPGACQAAAGSSSGQPRGGAVASWRCGGWPGCAPLQAACRPGRPPATGCPPPACRRRCRPRTHRHQRQLGAGCEAAAVPAAGCARQVGCLRPGPAARLPAAPAVELWVRRRAVPSHVCSQGTAGCPLPPCPASGLTAPAPCPAPTAPAPCLPAPSRPLQARHV